MLTNVIQFPERNPIQIDLVRRLEALLIEAKDGQICSLAYIVERGDASHGCGMAGKYLDNPESAFIPVSKGLFGLCTHIHDCGLNV